MPKRQMLIYNDYFPNQCISDISIIYWSYLQYKNSHTWHSREGEGSQSCLPNLKGYIWSFYQILCKYLNLKDSYFMSRKMIQQNQEAFCQTCPHHMWKKYFLLLTWIICSCVIFKHWFFIIDLHGELSTTH